MVCGRDGSRVIVSRWDVRVFGKVVYCVSVDGLSMNSREFFVMEGIDVDVGGVCRGIGWVGGLVDVFVVNVDGVGDEGGVVMMVVGIVLFEVEEFEFGLDFFEEVLIYDDGWGWCW